MRRSITFAVVALAALATDAPPAHSFDRGQWGESPVGDPRLASGTDAVGRSDRPCCGELDAFWADSFEVEGDHYVAIVTDDRFIPDRPNIPAGTRIPVPNNKMKFDAGKPTGHGVLFARLWPVGTAWTYCYVAPGGV